MTGKLTQQPEFTFRTHCKLLLQSREREKNALRVESVKGLPQFFKPYSRDPLVETPPVRLC